MQISSCTVCNVYERLQMPVIGQVSLIIGSVLAVFSMFVWPLLFVWPVLFMIGFGMAMGHGACTECRID